MGGIMKRNVRIDWKSTYDASMALCKYVNEGNRNPRSIVERWRNVFNCVLRDLGFPKKTRDTMWYGLANGNWERLHTTEEEDTYTPEKWLQELTGNVFYCSDRYTLDRLTRCHWTFRQWYRSLRLGWRDGWRYL